MAEKLIIDDGMLELEINGNGVLRFNASDTNVYQRFFALLKELPTIQKQYEMEIEPPDETEEMELVGDALNKAHEIDIDIKQRLAAAFGGKNDFDALLDGVNLMAFGRNGERVITNLLNGLMPYMEAGTKKHMVDTAAVAVAEAKRNREQRRAQK